MVLASLACPLHSPLPSNFLSVPFYNLFLCPSSLHPYPFSPPSLPFLHISFLPFPPLPLLPSSPPLPFPLYPPSFHPTPPLPPHKGGRDSPTPRRLFLYRRRHGNPPAGDKHSRSPLAAVQCWMGYWLSLARLLKQQKQSAVCLYLLDEQAVDAH